MKQPECDREADRILALQTRSLHGSRPADKLLCMLFVAAIAVFALLFWIVPDRTHSETENRELASLPAFTAKDFLSGQYTSDFAVYMADQFPARDFFVHLKALSETAQLRLQNNGVIFGSGGTLIARDDFPNTANLQKNLSAVAAFRTWCEAQEIPVTVAIAGRSADVLDGCLPPFYGSAYSDRIWAVLEEDCTALSLPLLNLRNPLRTRAAAGEYVYYRTDHHWTSLGAYYAYTEIAREMGLDAADLSEFTREPVSDAFYGTTWSTAGASFIAPDSMEYFRYSGDTDYTTEIVDTGSSFAGFYDESYLAKKDKYSSFLSGNRAMIRVTKNNPAEPRETLLLLKDSFAHSVAPFLARHYDLIIVDLRYYKKSVAAQIRENRIDRVLLLYNIDSFTSSAQMGMLEAGLTESAAK